MGWRVEADVRPEVVEKLGALHFLHTFLQRLDLVAIVDRVCGRGPSKEISHGEVFHALVLCRLSTGPHGALYRVAEWAQDAALTAVTGFDPQLLNDDRLARTLDVVFKHLESVKAALALHAVREFGLALEHCLWDVTSVLLTGDHPDEKGAPEVRRGYSRSGAPKKRQVRVVATATADGAVPLLHQTCAGNTEDSTTVVAAFEALRETLGELVPDRLLLSGDTKASAVENLEAIAAAQCCFIAPLAASDRLSRVFREQLSHLQPLEYQRQPAPGALPGAPPTGAYTYWGVETTWTIQAKGQPKREFRLLVIRSAEEQQAVRANRRKQYTRLIANLQTLRDKLAHPYYRDHPERVEPAIQKQLQGARGIGSYVQITRTPAAPGDVADFTWRLDRALLRHTMALDGVYGLVTNQDPETGPLVVALEAWKEQKHLEKRFHNLKGPLAVQPVFLSKPTRIAALILVLMTALMGFTLLEREVRRNLPPGEELMVGLLARGVKSRPTGQSILRPFGVLLVRWRPGEEHHTILRWPPLHADLYRLAGLPVPQLE